MSLVWAQEEEISVEELRAAIQQSVEIKDADVDLLLGALETYEAEGDRSDIEALWASEDVALRFVSTMIYVTMLELEDLQQEAAHLLSYYPDNEPGILSGLIGHSPEGVDYLLQNYDAYNSDTLSLLLEALLQEPAGNQAEWLSLWESRREEYDALILDLQDPIIRRNLALKANFQALRTVTDDFANDLPALDLIGDTLSTMDDARDLAMRVERTEAVVRGDRHLFFSEYEQAVAEYRNALEEEPDDVYPRYLMGCALFELGQYEAASKAFGQVTVLNAEVVSAEYMSKLAARRSERPDESLLTAAWLLSDETNISERIGMMGANDPMIQRLLGDQMLGKSGIYQISDSELLELAAAEADRPEVLAGMVLLTSREGKWRRIIQWAGDYPDNTHLQKAVFSFSQREHRYGDHELVIEALEICRVIDPRNRYFLDVEVAWLGGRVEPLAADQFPEDWAEFQMDVGPISKEQLALIQQSNALHKYASVSGELKQCAFAAMDHLSMAYRALDSNRYQGPDFFKFRDLFDQFELSIELALLKKDFAYANELLVYMERVVTDMKSNTHSLIDLMAAEAFLGQTETLTAKSNRAQKILKQEDLDLEERRENSATRKALKLYLMDVVFEMIPLPSLRNAFAEVAADPEVYIGARANALENHENE
ncbi:MULTISPECIES: tetratricopeptide repeat protein [unclassified Lentimonas]|uniref:tetratricopeptide repeat protein n=1 Tax=unclassified Lentimonas TaxID=2630993 RepID=UPI00138A3629|nr:MULTISPECIES: tetratricopeptide repeat protein [unclassified Lentimonas]